MIELKLVKGNYAYKAASAANRIALAGDVKHGTRLLKEVIIDLGKKSK